VAESPLIVQSAMEPANAGSDILAKALQSIDLGRELLSGFWEWM
jgi:hypothetical protein